MNTTTLEQNRKTVLKTWLESVGAGNNTLTAQQMANITPIAEGCPLVDGSAVYMARALYRLNIPREFVDDSLCLPVGYREQSQAVDKGNDLVRLIPNPANDLVTLTGIAASIEMPVNIDLYSSDGIRRLNMKVISAQVQIPTQNLPPGVYWCAVTRLDGEITTLKLIVQH